MNINTLETLSLEALVRLVGGNMTGKPAPLPPIIRK